MLQARRPYLINGRVLFAGCYLKDQSVILEYFCFLTIYNGNSLDIPEFRIKGNIFCMKGNLD